MGALPAIDEKGGKYTLDAAAPGTVVNHSAAQTAGPTQTFGFGQPTQRAFQSFSAGGPRALQLGARFTSREYRS